MSLEEDTYYFVRTCVWNGKSAEEVLCMLRIVWANVLEEEKKRAMRVFDARDNS